MRAVPAVGIMNPASIRIVVDLPAPFGPRNPSTSPRRTLKDTLSTAVKLPKHLVSPSISISGGRSDVSPPSAAPTPVVTVRSPQFPIGADIPQLLANATGKAAG